MQQQFHHKNLGKAYSSLQQKEEGEENFECFCGGSAIDNISIPKCHWSGGNSSSGGCRYNWKPITTRKVVGLSCFLV
jgi:hypothetical protein